MAEDVLVYVHIIYLCMYACCMCICYFQILFRCCRHTQCVQQKQHYVKQQQCGTTKTEEDKSHTQCVKKTKCVCDPGIIHESSSKLKLMQSIAMYVCLSVYLSVCLSVCMPVSHTHIITHTHTHTYTDS